MKKEMLKNITIVGLLLITTGLIAYEVIDPRTTSGETSELIVYKAYDDDLIQIQNRTNAKVQANLINHKQSLAVYITSLSLDNMDLVATIKVIDSQNKIIYEETVQTFLIRQEKAGIVFSFPTLEDTKLKEIKLEISQKENKNHHYDISQFISSIDKNIDQYGNTLMTAKINYQGEKNLSNVRCVIVALKEDKIVNQVVIERANLAPKEEISEIFVIDMIQKKDNQNRLISEQMEYDKIEAFVSYYEEVNNE